MKILDAIIIAFVILAVTYFMAASQYQMRWINAAVTPGMIVAEVKR